MTIPFMPLDGPTGRTDGLLNDVLMELMRLNMQVQELLLKESQEVEPPVIQVSGPEMDMEPLVAAIGASRTPVDFTPVLEALAALDRQEDTEVVTALSAVQKAVEDLGVSMRAIAGTSVSGGGSVFLQHTRDNPAHVAVQDELQDTRYDWTSAGSSSVPLYIGTANPGASTSNDTWKVQKYTYITGPAGDSVPSLVQTAFGPWDSRVSLF